MDFANDYIDFESALAMQKIEDYISPYLKPVDPAVYDIPKTCLSRVRLRNVKTGKVEDVPCGCCLVCLAKQANDWYIRFQIEQKYCLDSFFVTLTQEDAVYEPLCVDTIQRYFKRVRSMGFRFKYVCLGEYGPKTCRAHYHILFFLDAGSTPDFLSALSAQWQQRGIVDVKRPTKNHLFYVAKYNSKLFLKYVTIKLSSRRPAIGLRYDPDSPAARLMDSYIVEGNMVFNNPEDGLTYAIPRYFRKKADDGLYSFHDKPDSLNQFIKPLTIESQYDRYYCELARAYNSFCQRKL